MKSNFRTVSHAYYAILIDRKKLQERERFPNATPRNGKLNAKRNETKRTAKQIHFVQVTKGSAFLDDRLSLSSSNILERATTWLGLLLIKSLRAARRATIDFDMRFISRRLFRTRILIRLSIFILSSSITFNELINSIYIKHMRKRIITSQVLYSYIISHYQF